jgi:hypothetical protein
MKTLKINPLLKFIVATVAIAISTGSTHPANAQESSRTAEIGWDSRFTTMGLDKIENIGKTYDFYCQTAPKDLIHAPVWGTDVYTINSGICSTAVHSGMIAESGGTISIELLKGQEFYSGSTKNNIQSEDHIGTELSYTFIGEPLADNLNSQQDNQSRGGSGIERVMVQTVQRGVERSIERAIIDLFK